MIASSVTKTFIRILVLVGLASLGALAMLDDGPDVEEVIPAAVVDQVKKLPSGPSTATHRDQKKPQGTHGTFL